jgi:nicotinamidase-related amidase
MTNTALLLIDIQQDYFPDGAFPLPNIIEAANNAKAVLAWARHTGIRIIHIRHEETDTSAGFLAADSTGSRIHSLVLPMEGETVITKHYPNAFRDTALLASMKDIDNVLIVGAMSNMCVDATARAAFDHGISVTVIHDACAASSLEFQGSELSAEVVHGSFMSALASAYGSVVSTEQVIGTTHMASEKSDD